MKYFATSRMALWLQIYGTLLFVFAALLSPSEASAQDMPEIVCIQCHSKMPDKYSRPVTLWRGSIHAESGIFCNGCHGGDPKDAVNAMSPLRGFLGSPEEPAVPSFCGRCHVGVLKDYLASAHGRMLGKGGPTCVTCHGSHQVVKASLELINEKDCSRCHGFERARVIRDAMQDTETLILAIDGRLNASKKIGADTEKLEKTLFAIRNRFHTLFHNVNVDLVKQESAGIQADLNKIKVVLDQRDVSDKKRRIAGAAGVSLLLLIALVLHLLRKTFN